MRDPLPGMRRVTCLPHAIIWDLDGTLIDSAADLTTALNLLLQEHGLRQLEEVTVRPMIGDGVAPLIERAFAAAGAGRSREPREASVRRFLSLYGMNPVRRTRPVEGALEVMDSLTRAGCVHGICTNKPEAITRTILDRLGFADRTGAVVGGDSMEHKKPHPAPVLSCLRQLAVPGAPALLVGDSSVDVLAARAAGLPVIIVALGYSRDPVRSLGADAVVERLDQIPDVMAQLPALARRRSVLYFE